MANGGAGGGRFQALIWGSLSVGVVSALSLAGALLLPFLKGDATQRRRVLSFAVAVAVATLSADALLHLIPQILGLHAHSHGEDHGDHLSDETDHHHHHHHHHSHEEDEGSTHDHHNHSHHHQEEEGMDEVAESRAHLLKLSLILFVVFALYIAQLVATLRKKTTILDEAEASAEIAWTTESGGGRRSSEIDETVTEQSQAQPVREPRFLCGLTSAALVILLGDGLHNTLDGVAIGASFLVSPRMGLSTSIAVAFHELPHELGDLAVLLESGLSMRRALLYNLLSSLTAFLGLWVGIGVGNLSSQFETWLLALTAGMFLYVSFVDMLRHLRDTAAHAHDRQQQQHKAGVESATTVTAATATTTTAAPQSGSHSSGWTVDVALQATGLLFGFLLIFAIAWFEYLFE